MKKKILITLVLFFSCLSLSAEQDYLSDLLDGIPASDQSVRDEIREHVSLACAIEMAKGDTDVAKATVLASANQVDRLIDALVPTFKATPLRSDRMAAYPAWRDQCLYNADHLSVATSVSKREMEREIFEYAVFPCVKEKHADNDEAAAVRLIEKLIERTGRGPIDKMVQAYYKVVRATESRDDRMAAYRVMKNSCLNQ